MFAVKDNHFNFLSNKPSFWQRLECFGKRVKRQDILSIMSFYNSDWTRVLELFSMEIISFFLYFFMKYMKEPVTFFLRKLHMEEILRHS
jgi:hypothetical protein